MSPTAPQAAPDLSALVLPRRAALVGAGLCALAGTGLAAVGDGRLTLGSGPTRTQATRRAADPGGFSRVRTSAPVVALTFDDGPDPAYTPTVLDLLARAGAQATFFCVGTNVEAHPAIVERIVREGHLLANHTHDHAPLESILGREVERQVRDGRSALVEVAGLRAGSVQGARFLRPPRGFTTPNVARIAGRLDERGPTGACAWRPTARATTAPPVLAWVPCWTQVTCCSRTTGDTSAAGGGRSTTAARPWPPCRTSSRRWPPAGCAACGWTSWCAAADPSERPPANRCLTGRARAGQLDSSVSAEQRAQRRTVGLGQRRPRRRARTRDVRTNA
ncbi:polysaccharide deacetylase family protein [Arsenicicoccus piscis]|uniref:polysaccharide deacetylase family protein n=1 Tax=Arsenicicoccus piscis TaxID=673954 RepID=UPI0024E0E2FD|nr:polysaccharide deacetylase family protein [Arsenicicoccus piscis]